MYNNLKKYRVKMGKTQKEIAREAGVSERHYQGLEVGKNDPNVYLAIRIARAINCTVEELFTNELMY